MLVNTLNPAILPLFEAHLKPFFRSAGSKCCKFCWLSKIPLILSFFEFHFHLLKQLEVIGSVTGADFSHFCS
jgi:hypothetical protein